MNMNRKSAVLVGVSLLLFIFFQSNASALEPVKTGDPLADSASIANRRTALRCLSLAKEYAAQKDWNAVISQSMLGLAYDDGIADLWYVYAVAENELDATKAEILPLVTKALTQGEWVDYNRDGARILYADILCDTGRYKEVPAVLDAKPVLFSADAEYIRAKAYYRMKDNDSIQTARTKIDTARKIYPDDTRFPLLFFMSESPLDDNETVRKIAESFISRISLYTEAAPDKDAELEIYASLFARRETQVRMLKSFSARGLQHPLYAAAALAAGLLDEEKAFDYFTSFADGSIEYAQVLDFLTLLRSDKVKQLADTYFTAYSGIILRDCDGDGIDDMYVKYYRGRPDTIVYDKNQDGVVDWRIVCDFGVPVHADITENNMSVSWDPYPSLKEVVYKEANKNQEQSELAAKISGSTLIFNLVRETLQWTPVDIIQEETVHTATGASFFYPQLKKNVAQIDDKMLIAAASNYIIPSKERPNAQITFTILDGKAQVAQYSVNGKMYAQAEFNSGIPAMRTVDADGDGVFETTEFYGFDKDGTMEVHTMDEERAVMTNLFGYPLDGAGYYLRLIQIDRDGDTTPDFTEEYLEHNGKITSWDTDSDGLWDVRYISYPRIKNAQGKPEPLVEDALFYETAKRDLVTVTSIDGIPSKVTVNKEEFPVQRDAKYQFYWIGKQGRSEFAKKALDTLNQIPSQAVCTTVEDNGLYMICVRIGTYYYGQIVQSQELGKESENGKK